MSIQQPLSQLKVPIELTEDPKSIENNINKWKLLVSPREIMTAFIEKTFHTLEYLMGLSSPLTC